MLHKRQNGFSVYCVDAPKGQNTWKLGANNNEDHFRTVLDHAETISLFLPNIKANKQIATRDAFTTHRTMANRTTWQNPRLHIDGIFDIHRGESAWWLAAGCALLVACGGGKMAVLHAGRDSLLPSDGERFGTVIFALAETFRKERIPSTDVDLHGYFAINPLQFAHQIEHADSIYRERNEAMAHAFRNYWGEETMLLGRDPVLGDCVYPDLGALICAQGKKAGFRSVSYEMPLPDEYPNTRTLGRENDRVLVGAVRHH